MKRPPSNRMALFFASPRLPGLDSGTRTARAQKCSKPVSPKPKTCPHLWHSSPTKMPLWIYHHSTDRGGKLSFRNSAPVMAEMIKEKRWTDNVILGQEWFSLNVCIFFVDGKNYCYNFQNWYYSTCVVMISCKGHIFISAAASIMTE